MPSATPYQSRLVDSLHDVGVKEVDFSAQSVMLAVVAGTVISQVVASAEFVGRATGGDVGVITKAQALTILNVEDGAEVTSAAHVNTAGAVMETDYDAQSVLAATLDDTPVMTVIADSEFVGRPAGGDVGAMTVTEALAILALSEEIVTAVIAVADASGGATDSLMTLQLSRVTGAAINKAAVCLIYASDTLYAGLNDPNANITLGTITEGSVVASSAAAGWWLVKTDATGLFGCTATNGSDETVYFSATSAMGGIDALAAGALVLACVPDDATWAA